jgi:SAM-dependent methyltransferase
MQDLYEKYLKYMDGSLILAVASNPAEKNATLPVKLKVKPVVIKGAALFQVTRTVGTKELHENLSAEDAAKLLASSLDPSDTTQKQHFRQLEVKNDSTSVVTLVSKKGTVTVKEHRNPAAAGTAPDAPAARKKGPNMPEGGCSYPGPAIRQGSGVCPVPGDLSSIPSHNRKKNYLLEEGVPVPFLVQLGVMTPDGRVVKARYDKFRQINRYLEFVEDILPSLPRGREISIIDFGCGKSYLTFALYYYLHEKQGYDVHITGLDLKADVIAECSRLAKSFGYEKLEFLHGDIADYTGTDSVDMVVTLHACDTATDYALFKAIKWGAKVIFCVPCCQHELNGQIDDSSRKPIMKYGLIKERVSALYTDALRANMLEAQGYKTQILEFIDMEHTPKNILIRAVKTGPKMMPKGFKKRTEAQDGDQKEDYKKVMKEIGADPTLYRLLNDEKEK